ncbi:MULTISPECIES: NAD(P)/FAD-dependent oxidoreductase [Alphaproteobacteria]|uniref:NAD/FAD-binding protein n=2 Tax=Alphaproteobacteria TaxID=28211 RepID=A0A512HIT0_9HYPH|nr:MULTISPECIES: FAD-dependent oxidoreductase [Alphaproteobacteria]GEO85300.1 NAD/FAD-binding protein [Ciceribacter naphthalenivorans]GLR20939.1 NAD/FAD-binding protein [Ciceribacter naphthalenivorans]GLT03795.1 NAD/FAD-binding protein [Sphingomonas psychrolutea]
MDNGFSKAAVSQRRRIAVVGSGISGLSAAWLLGRNADVVLFEGERRPGGHANTVTANVRDREVVVDTGFIVYNDRNYPNLVALFDNLKVPTLASNMSFSASLDSGAFEYSGSGLKGLLGQKSNLLRPRFWSMVSDVMRFYKEAPGLLDRPELADASLGEYLASSRYSASFIEDHLLPMGAAIWSTTAREMRLYPLHAFIRFFANHGLLSLDNRPRWRTVAGGSREYVKRLLDDFSGELRLGRPVRRIRRDASGIELTDGRGHVDRFHDVVIATHADDALGLLADADDLERETLGAFQYTPNVAVLHSDPRLMPKRRQVWSSWNYMADQGEDGSKALCVTYWMNRLQSLDPETPLFVTLNPGREIDPKHVIRSFDYRHPLFDLKANAAQRRLLQLQGRHHTWFCGAYFGNGFHEDGLQAGLAVAEALGGLHRPWNIENESGRIDHLRQREAAE